MHTRICREELLARRSRERRGVAENRDNGGEEGGDVNHIKWRARCSLLMHLCKKLDDGCLRVCPYGPLC